MTPPALLVALSLFIAAMQSHPSDSNCPPWCALPICGCAAMLDHASRRRLGRRDIRGLAAREATRALPGRRGCPATLGRRARAATRECKVRESAPPAFQSRREKEVIPGITFASLITHECKVRESAPPAHRRILSHPESADRFQFYLRPKVAHGKCILR